MCTQEYKKQVIYLIRMKKQIDPRQTYISAPTNLQYKSLWKEIITSLKEYWKTEINNIMKNSYAAFLRYEISKAL